MSTCPKEHVRVKKTQFAAPGGAFSKSLPTTTCSQGCDDPDPTLTLDQLHGWDAANS